LTASKTLLNIKIMGQSHVGFRVFLECMIPLEPVGLDSQNVIR